MGLELKWFSLLTLVVQNSAMVLFMRYSKTIPGPAYISSTAVVLAELLKLLASTAIYASEVRSTPNAPPLTARRLFADVFGPHSDWAKMTVPAVLYFVQNNLQYLAVQHLDAATFQVTYQMKILTTALFSVLMLNRSLSIRKWLALCLLTAGIALVQMPSGSSAGKKEIAGNKFVGLVAVLVACVLSGLAGVWFEKVLKGSKASLFLRNIQLSFFSILPGFLFGVMWYDGDAVSQNGFFYGYTIWTYFTVACQAFGGLVVAVVVKYADNILKGFATSLSIIICSIASFFFFDFQITWLFLGGSVCVLYASHLYGLPDAPEKQPVEKVDLAYLRAEEGETSP
ncbi:nucleotide-sugar transporter-domain-containing protein [Blyttiomyces helicus]|uniref:Nucleotide-sugar transporter-domain-containing protein n=1 Tax=Blyttiomyces helicus TaxID=388810 RepID=A0A4P9WNP3_9FUNG|nr:nucleotide-sugar transporter-domain-containing protein [Blyttiomyces helicus]|eukprot:RKO93905.1 nucleotide-sugar transporter-domain-containing protein [Blyttiomyces helicus]